MRVLPVLSPLSTIPLVSLKGGVYMPKLGLGCYQMAPQEAYHAVSVALKAGIRHIDTAALYQNEPQVGQAIRDSGVPREELFVTTKLWETEHGYDVARKAFEASRKKLGLDYVDLYLMHSPRGGKRAETWRAMEDLQEEGQVRAIGVSNFGTHHLEEIFTYCRVPPQMNQIELSPYLTRPSLVDFCVANGVTLTAYSPLTKGVRLSDPRLIKLSEAYGRTPAQVLIRWCLQKGYVVIPKSVRQERIIENMQVFEFEISAEDMATLDSFDEGLVTGWDPTVSPL